MNAVAIRPVAPDDDAAVATIYAHHVLHGTATFDLEPPPPAFWANKIAAINTQGHPFLVAESVGDVLGYAYASPFRDRPAYARTCENSIYVRADAMGRGVGSLLIAALLDAATASGFSEMIAVIGGGEPASIALHTKAGFRHAGRMERVGEKFGRLLDTVYMQRTLKDPT